MGERAEHAAKNRRRQRTDHLGADSIAPKDRQQAGDYRRHCHKLWAETEERPLHDRVAQMRDGKHAVLEFCSLHCFFEVDHHNDCRLHRCTEERDEPDPDGDREVIVKKPEQIEPSGEGKRHGKQNVRGLQEGAVRQIKQDVDDPDGNRDDNLEPFFGTNFALKLPAPVVVITGGHFHFCANGFVCVGDDAASVAATRIH